jgi:hypothetical protein
MRVNADFLGARLDQGRGGSMAVEHQPFGLARTQLIDHMIIFWLGAVLLPPR